VELVKCHIDVDVLREGGKVAGDRSQLNASGLRAWRVLIALLSGGRKRAKAINNARNAKTVKQP
jgi:hypothetical protein